MIDPAIFENLQTKIDEETVVRDVSFPIKSPRDDSRHEIENSL